MVKCNFTLDIIVVSVDIPILQDTRNLSVNVILNNLPITLTSRCKTLRKFRSGRSYDFQEKPEILLRKFYKYPLQLILSYDDVILAESQMAWPTKILDRIDGTPQEITHVAKMRMQSAREIIGHVELIIRIKCAPIERANNTTKPKLLAHNINICQNEHCSLAHDQKRKRSFEQKLASKLGLCSQHRALQHLTKQFEKLIQETEKQNPTFNSNTTHIKREKGGRCDLDRHPKRVHNMCTNQKLESCPHCQEHCDGSSFVSDNEAKQPSCLKQNLNHSCRAYTPGCSNCSVGQQRKSYCPNCHHSSIGTCDHKELTVDDILAEYQNNEKFTQLKNKRSNWHHRNCPYWHIRSHQPSTSESFEVQGKRRVKESKSHLSRIFEEQKESYETYFDGNTNRESSQTELASENDMDARSRQTESHIYLKKLHKRFCGQSKTKISTKESHIKRKTSTDVQNMSNYEKTSQRPSKRLKGVFTKPPRNSAKSEFFPENVGDRTRRIQDRHRSCNNNYLNTAVPPNMGWRWNSSENYQRGWKPGFIPKNIKDIMEYFVEDFPTDTIPNTHKNSEMSEKKTALVGEDQSEHPPMLKINKKNDVYIISMLPLKNSDDLKNSTFPYAEMHPVKFKITRKPVIAHHKTLKKKLKALGFPKCCCHRPISQCCCRTLSDKKILLKTLKEECTKLEVPFYKDSLVLSDTTASENELEISITPPVARLKPLKNNVINQATQYNRYDWLISKRGNVRPHRCAAALFPKLFRRKPLPLPKENLVIVVGNEDRKPTENIQTPIPVSVKKL